jgi:LEA14-like dessication related protein
MMNFTATCKIKVWAWMPVVMAMALLSGACSGLRPDYEKPTVTINSFRMLETEGIAPRFEIGLHIINPNRSALKLSGVSYTVHLEGHNVVTGVASDLPTIDPYGSGDVLLNAGVDLLSAIQLVLDLVRQKPESMSYEVKLKLDPGGFQPNIYISKQGHVRLSKEARLQEI